MTKSGNNLGPVDLISDVPLLPSIGRGIWWPRVVLHQVSLTFGHPLGQANLWSDVHSLVEASSGQEWY